MKKIGKVTLIIAIFSTSLAIASAGVGITYAAYWSKKSIDQRTGYQGALSVFPIFLNTNGSGNAGWEKDDAVFYMYAYNNDGSVYTWIEATKIASALIYNSELSSVSVTYTPLYWFRFDSSIYTKFNFVRFSPNGANVPSWNRDDSPRSLWDQTSQITYSSLINLYHINNTDRNGNDGYGHDTAGYTTSLNKVAEDTSSSKLYFMPTTTS